MSLNICIFGGAGDELISPCMCKGTQQFVHRNCLDHWRSVKVHFCSWVKCVGLLFYNDTYHFIFDRKTKNTLIFLCYSQYSECLIYHLNKNEWYQNSDVSFLCDYTMISESIIPVNTIIHWQIWVVLKRNK